MNTSLIDYGIGANCRLNVFMTSAVGALKVIGLSGGKPLTLRGTLFTEICIVFEEDS
jgi:hypothetical protein